jgi:hypothetical protein
VTMASLGKRYPRPSPWVQWSRAVFVLVVVAGTWSCGFKFKDNAQIRGSAFSAQPPRRVAVMPFRNATTLSDAGEIARSAFFNALLTRHYEAADTEAVDRALAEIGIGYAKDPLTADPSMLKGELKADAALYGEVLEFSKSYWTVYSHLRLRLRVALFDLGTGKEIFSDDAVLWNRRLSPPFSIPGIIFSSLETLWHLREAQKYETFTEIAHRVLAEMPEFASEVTAGERFIKSIHVDVAKQTLVAGDVVQVSVAASPGERGYFDLGQMRRKIPLTEISPGTYAGRYQIQSGDNADYCLVQVCLFDQANVPLAGLNGKVSFSVDTSPPQGPAILNYYTTDHSIILVLRKPEDPDFEEFNVFRSVNGKEMQWLGKTNEAMFEDEDVEQLTRYDYFVEASDRVGNASRSDKPFTVSLPRHGPITLDEDLTHDAVLTRFAGPYYVQRVISIAPVATVHIQPGVELHFAEEAGLAISGQLVAVGQPTEPIRFTGSHGWKGLHVVGESGEKHALIRDASFNEAECAVIVEDSSAEMENVEFVSNETGIAVAGKGNLTLKNGIVRKNECGVNLGSGNLDIEGCTFTKNKIGLKVFPERIIVGSEKKEGLSFKYSTISHEAR